MASSLLDREPPSCERRSLLSGTRAAPLGREGRDIVSVSPTDDRLGLPEEPSRAGPACC